MKKLKLILEALEVESFATGREGASRGTVMGRALPTQQQNEVPTEEPTDAESGLQPCSLGCDTIVC